MRNTSPLHENVNVNYVNPCALRQIVQVGMLRSNGKRTNLTVRGTKIEEKHTCQRISSYANTGEQGVDLLSPRALFIPTNSLPNRPGESITDHQNHQFS